jgi:hypothetical protein
MSVKNQVKGFIDLFIDRFGRGLAGVLLIFFSSVYPLSVSQLSLLVCGMIGVWVHLSIAVRKEYLNSSGGLKNAASGNAASAHFRQCDTGPFSACSTVRMSDRCCMLWPFGRP